MERPIVEELWPLLLLGFRSRFVGVIAGGIRGLKVGAKAPTSRRPYSSWPSSQPATAFAFEISAVSGRRTKGKRSKQAASGDVCNIGIMEEKMATTFIFGLYRGDNGK